MDTPSTFNVPPHIAIRMVRKYILKESLDNFRQRFHTGTKDTPISLSSISRYESGERADSIPPRLLSFCYNTLFSYIKENKVCDVCNGTGYIEVAVPTRPTEEIENYFNAEVRYVLEDYFLHKEKHYQSLKQIADDFGLTRERLRQLKDDVTKKLKKDGPSPRDVRLL